MKRFLLSLGLVLLSLSVFAGCEDVDPNYHYHTDEEWCMDDNFAGIAESYGEERRFFRGGSRAHGYGGHGHSHPHNGPHSHNGHGHPHPEGGFHHGGGGFHGGRFRR